MKITEIEWGTGKTYVDENGCLWQVYENDLYAKNTPQDITDCFELKELLSMNFEEQVDWSKVEVDTPILVSGIEEPYLKKYFAKYENGVVYAYADGMASWSANGKLTSWKYAKLGDAK